MYSILPLSRRDCGPLTEESAACQIHTLIHQHHSKEKCDSSERHCLLFYCQTYNAPPPSWAVFTSSLCVPPASLYLRFFEPHDTRIQTLLSHLFFLNFKVTLWMCRWLLSAEKKPQRCNSDWRVLRPIRLGWLQASISCTYRVEDDMLIPQWGIQHHYSSKTV